MVDSDNFCATRGAGWRCAKLATRTVNVGGAAMKLCDLCKEPLSRAALRALVAATVLALGDTAEPKSAPWWHYNFVLRALGRETTVELVGIALQGPTPVTAACWTKRDGSQRTTGGAFFALARSRLSNSRWRRAWWLAGDCFERSQAKARAA